MSSSGIFLAQELGYFKQEGLDIDIIPFKKSGAPMTVLLSNGELHIGGGNLSTGLWNAINKGIKIKLVADKGHIEKGQSYIGLLVRKDLVESGKFKSPADMKGYKMGLTSLGGVSQQIAAEKILKAHGRSLKDVEFIKMSYSQMNLALASKDLDATINLEPYIAKAEIDGTAKLMAKVYDYYSDQQSAAIFYSQQFIEKHPSEAAKFIKAYVRGVRAYNDAFVKGKNKKATIEMLKKHIKIKDDRVWNNMIPIGLNPNGYINDKSLANDLKWYGERGYLKTVPDIKTVVDHTYLDKAIKELGPYDRSK